MEQIDRLLGRMQVSRGRIHGARTPRGMELKTREEHEQVDPLGSERTDQAFVFGDGPAVRRPAMVRDVRVAAGDGHAQRGCGPARTLAPERFNRTVDVPRLVCREQRA
jgi:hypothetical protein